MKTYLAAFIFSFGLFVLLQSDIAIGQPNDKPILITPPELSSGSLPLMQPDIDPAFDMLVRTIKNKKIDQLPIGERVAEIGKLLLDRPYIEKSLEVTNDESMTVCNLLGFDCVTFFETSWAMATLVKKNPNPSYNDYVDEVTNHRYRNGIRNGYASRLHYTSDYFFDNAKRGNLKEVTKIIGGKKAKLETKTINFMTMHPSLYSQLQNDPMAFVQIDTFEQRMAQRGGFYYIPKKAVEDISKGIQTGDLIGITTTVNGIDCSHTGIAIKDGKKVRFMHASSSMHKVIISEKTLDEYLEDNSKQTGIMIFRAVEPTVH